MLNRSTTFALIWFIEIPLQKPLFPNNTIHGTFQQPKYFSTDICYKEFIFGIVAAKNGKKMQSQITIIVVYIRFKNRSNL